MCLTYLFRIKPLLRSHRSKRSVLILYLLVMTSMPFESQYKPTRLLEPIVQHGVILDYSTRSFHQILLDRYLSARQIQSITNLSLATKIIATSAVPSQGFSRLNNSKLSEYLGNQLGTKEISISCRALYFILSFLYDVKTSKNIVVYYYCSACYSSWSNYTERTERIRHFKRIERSEATEANNGIKSISIFNTSTAIIKTTSKDTTYGKWI